jgi:hypothetical protein
MIFFNSNGLFYSFNIILKIHIAISIKIMKTSKICSNKLFFFFEEAKLKYIKPQKLVDPSAQGVPRWTTRVYKRIQTKQTR